MSGVKQIVERTRNRFAVAVSETDHHDSHQQAELGLVAVGNDRRVINSVLDRAVDFIESLGTAVVSGHELEMINF